MAYRYSILSKSNTAASPRYPAGLMWSAFVVAALLLMAVLSGVQYAVAIPLGAIALALIGQRIGALHLPALFKLDMDRTEPRRHRRPVRGASWPCFGWPSASSWASTPPACS